MALPVGAITAGISLVSSIFDRGKQKKIDAKNAKAAAQADYENKMQHANVNRMNKKASDAANKRNQKQSVLINNRNVKLVRETNRANAKNVRDTNTANAKAQLDADTRSEASAAAARQHDIEAAELNRSQGLEDIKYSAVRLREAASLGGFNPLTFLEATGGVGPVAGSGVGGRALQFSAVSRIAASGVAPQVSMGPASQAYLRNAYASQAVMAAPLRSTASIAGALQDMVLAPGQAAQAALDQESQKLKNNVLSIEAERLKYSMVNGGRVQTGPYRPASGPKVAASGKGLTPETHNQWIYIYDDVLKTTTRYPNPDLFDMGPTELVTGAGLISAANAAQNGVTPSLEYFRGGSTPPPKPVIRAPIARKASPKISSGNVSQSGKAGRYAR